MHAARKRRRRRQQPRQLTRECHACRLRRLYAGGHWFGRGEAQIFVCETCWEAIEEPARAEKERIQRAGDSALLNFLLVKCYELLERTRSAS